MKSWPRYIARWEKGDCRRVLKNVYSVILFVKRKRFTYVYVYVYLHIADIWKDTESVSVLNFQAGEINCVQYKQKRFIEGWQKAQRLPECLRTIYIWRQYQKFHCIIGSAKVPQQLSLDTKLQSESLTPLSLDVGSASTVAHILEWILDTCCSFVSSASSSESGTGAFDCQSPCFIP